MRTLSAEPTDYSPKIVILPWLQIDEPTEFCGVTIFPRGGAIDRARHFADNDLSAHVEFATSYFASGWRYPRPSKMTEDNLNNLTDDDVTPEMVQPSVIFLEDHVTVRRTDDVLAALAFACMTANDGGRYTNGVVFERYIQTLVKNPEFIVPLSRQMYGSKTTGTRAINLLVCRPHRCGEFQTPDKSHWEAIGRALDDAGGARIMEAVRALVAATQDIETIPEPLERSLYAIALERLLALTKAESKSLRPQIVAERRAQGMSAEKSERLSPAHFQSKRARQLLRPLLGPEIPGLEHGYYIARALDAIRRERNGVWHPLPSPGDLYAFEKQRAVRLNLIWFKATQALIDASLVEAGFADKDGPLALGILAIEAWLGSITENDGRAPEVASSIGPWLYAAIVCYKSLLNRRDSGAWRDYFDQDGHFVIPNRAPAIV